MHALHLVPNTESVRACCLEFDELISSMYVWAALTCSCITYMLRVLHKSRVLLCRALVKSCLLQTQ